MKQCLKCLSPFEDNHIHYGLHPTCFLSWFNVPHLAEFTGLVRQSASSFDNPSYTPQNSSFFHGKFKKYSADLHGSSYILKMREAEAPELPEVEYLCNQIAQLLDIPIADFYLIDLHQDIVFVTKNFIKHTIPIDLQHIYHFRPNEEHSCEGLLSIIEKVSNRPYDIRILIRTILFDALIGNHDRHGRNLAFLVKSNLTCLSPIYDNVSFLSLESGPFLKADFNPKGKISTKNTEEPSMKDYVMELKRLDYLEEIKLFFAKIDLEKIMRLVNASFCSTLMKSALERMIAKRFEELRNELIN